MNEFDRRVAESIGTDLRSGGIELVQVNLGFLCNQCCRHCHVEASPDRAEVMSWETMTLILAVARQLETVRFDLTGGAPELNPDFRRFVAALRQDGREVQVRTNLTVLLEPTMEDMVGFLRDHCVALVGSLPCYLEENVAAQRGAGVYARSVEAIRRLNAAGYGHRPDLPLNLVYNPGGPFLPPPQAELENDYRVELRQRFGIEFTRLLTITNMPIGRFMADLRRTHKDGEYLKLLMDSFNARTVDTLMCRRQISVAWDGTLYDCDFNLALGCPVNHGAPDSLKAFSPSALLRRRIVTGEHCFGCTAGAGSSCGGSLA